MFLARSLQLLPLGIGAAIRLSSITLGAVLIGFFFFQESLLSTQYLFIGLILFGVIVLGYKPIQVDHLKEKNIPLGFFYAALMGFAVVSGSSFMGSISRSLNPFVAGYFWEASIGILALFLCLLRYFILKHPIKNLSSKEFGSLLIRVAPAGVGSTFFALAITHGSVGITNAMLTGIIVITALFGVFFLQEKLNFFQWLGVSIIVTGIIAMNLF